MVVDPGPRVARRAHVGSARVSRRERRGATDRPDCVAAAGLSADRAKCPRARRRRSGHRRASRRQRRERADRQWSAAAQRRRLDRRARRAFRLPQLRRSVEPLLALRDVQAVTGRRARGSRAAHHFPDARLDHRRRRASVSVDQRRASRSRPSDARSQVPVPLAMRSASPTRSRRSLLVAVAMRRAIQVHVSSRRVRQARNLNTRTSSHSDGPSAARPKGSVHAVRLSVDGGAAAFMTVTSG
jgi:hypothetical protein